MIELALVGIDRAARVESENFVCQVQSRSHELQSLIEPVAALDIHLCVSVEILIAQGTLYPENRVVVHTWSIGIMLILISIDVCVVVAHTEAHREAGFIIREAKVPSVRSLTLQGRMIYSSLSAMLRVSGGEEVGEIGSRSCVAIVRGDSQTVQQTWKKRESLFP